VSNLEVDGQLEVLATYLRPNGCTGRTALDFESDEPVTYQHLSQHITQNQRYFLFRVTPLCPVCAVGLGTILGTNLGIMNLIRAVALEWKVLRGR